MGGIWGGKNLEMKGHISYGQLTSINSSYKVFCLSVMVQLMVVSAGL